MIGERLSELRKDAGLSDDPVTEAGRHIRLPTDFPPQAEAEAKRYIGYLYKVYKKK